MGTLAILEKMTFLTQKILFFKIESCLSLVDRFRIELSDTIFKIRKKIYTHEQYEDLVFNGDEDVGGSGTPREGEPALGAMRFVQLEVG